MLLEGLGAQTLRNLSILGENLQNYGLVPQEVRIRSTWQFQPRLLQKCARFTELLLPHFESSRADPEQGALLELVLLQGVFKSLPGLLYLTLGLQDVGLSQP